MMYRLWKVEYDEEHAVVTKQDYCKSKNQLMGAISKALDEEETIEDIAILKTENQNLT